MIKNIILDWSGTVVDDLDAVIKATNSVLKAFWASNRYQRRISPGVCLAFYGVL